MMNDYHVPMWGVIAGLAWLIAIGVMLAGWAVLLNGDDATGLMLGLSAMFVSSTAVSLTSRLIAGTVMTQIERDRPQKLRTGGN